MLSQQALPAAPALANQAALTVKSHGVDLVWERAGGGSQTQLQCLLRGRGQVSCHWKNGGDTLTLKGCCKRECGGGAPPTCAESQTPWGRKPTLCYQALQETEYEKLLGKPNTRHSPDVPPDQGRPPPAAEYTEPCVQAIGAQTPTLALSRGVTLDTALIPPGHSVLI